MLISNCCEAVFCEPGYPDNDMCSDCKEHAEAIEINPTVSETYRNMQDTPRGNMRWREKIKFVKKKKVVDKDIHNHPMGAGFAHKDHKDNG